ncbi:hypothetical protein GCM10010967_28040 [Dyadobacter beijingensis]|uniref:Peptidase M48 domain-containing protein n=1 Tax=Dyadobacter beijingensis TaxID=365489 RepID=A0ABQ2HXY9_9BACT|nr:M48 family metallopeptidase [Dyadobacter beijingensis]GGM93294.1 hypothetical protein GCM10010967_28040 [Dyadobacter beijingensis]
MPIDQIKTSDAFRKSTFRASLAIIQFVVIYLLLICGALLLTALCVLGAYTLVSHTFTIFTALMAVAIVCIGGFVLFFLIKFIFTKNVVDRSTLTEITEQDQPELFALIREIVQEVQTDFPKKVYLSPDVNAAVFYDSGFWSMFLPIRKNLQIGMGLVNTVTVSEFKGILAHEFGHFSQRSMKVGSYVYNVNYVIHNMLFDNESFDSTLERWSNVSGYIAVATTGAGWVIKGIKWSLGKAYNIVNLNYLNLSREMEFHADEVAAHVAGSAPLAGALRRFELADYALNSAANFYYQKGFDAPNIYPHHAFVLRFLAEKDQLAFQNGLPVVESNQNRYNKSKLVIADQWASHPSVDDRVQRLLQLNQSPKNEDARQAAELFRKVGEIQEAITQKMFDGVERKPHAETEVFEEAFVDFYNVSVFNEIYQGYYDGKNPVFPEEVSNTTGDINANELFNEQAVDLVYKEIAIQSDIQTIEGIHEGNYKVKSFDYDGNKYAAGEAAFLLPNLRNELAEVQRLVAENDARIYQFFYEIAAQQQKQTEHETLIANIKSVNAQNAAFGDLYMEVAGQSSFLTVTTPYDEIKRCLARLAETENKFKEQLAELQNNPLYSPKITDQAKEIFEQYIHNEEPYFEKKSYNEHTVQLMFNALNEFISILPLSQFHHKKELLDFQAVLFNATQPANIAS